MMQRKVARHRTGVVVLFMAGSLLVVLLGGLAWQPATLWGWLFADSLDGDRGQISLPGLQRAVRVRRDELGIPVVEAESMADLAYAAGWVMASDRIEQMVSFSLLAQGRLSEMAGEVTLSLDRYMRLLELDRAARLQLARLDPPMLGVLERFAEGVNAWLAAHRDRLPMGLALSGWQPEPWQPVDSMRVYALLTQALAVNVQEELAFMTAAARVGPQRAAWLFPVYPDEPLPHEEAARLQGLDWSASAMQAADAALQRLAGWTLEPSRLFPMAAAASNNWAVAPSRMAGGKSLIANDTHLLLSHPSLWMLIQLRSPDYSAAGIAIAGVPGIVAGSNGHLGWGMTMVMADTQDVFVEQTRDGAQGLEYLTEHGWQTAVARPERFRVKGGQAHQETFWHTRNGVLLNPTLDPDPVNILQPPAPAMPWSLVLRHNLLTPDDSLSAIFALGRAQTFAEARAQIQKIRFIALNVVFGDAENIGWQVTGRYPIRPKGGGQLPVPGWTGDYAWDGWLPVEQHPQAENPAEGFIATANHRSVPAEVTPLSRAWYYPERYERIVQVLGADARHTAEKTRALQFDQINPLVAKVQAMLTLPSMAAALEQRIADLAPADQRDARASLQTLLSFDGDMRPESLAASQFGVFEHLLVRQTFLDELGPDTAASWIGLMADSGLSYAAGQDHLLGRADSPFWNDVNTPGIEDKAAILARSLAGVRPLLRERLGGDETNWRWGRLHSYHWKSAVTEFVPYLPVWQQPLAGWLGRFLDRGPYPAGGDRNTVNVAGHTTGKDFSAWNIPAMRMVVDFSAEEPLSLINSGGQSANPLSRHYADGIGVWLQPGNRSMPLKSVNIEQQYNRVLNLQPGAAIR